MSSEETGTRARIVVAGILFGGLTACTHGAALRPDGLHPTAAALEWCDSSPLSVNCSDFADFVQLGAVVQAIVRGDIDNDGDQDVLVVVTREDDRTQVRPRGLLLLRRDENLCLSEVLSNANAIPCTGCGGMNGDPLQEIRIDPGSITLRLEGGSRELWSSQYRFEYLHDRNLWLLTSVVHNGLDRARGISAEKRLTPTDFGEVSMTTFSTEDYPADALP